MAKQTQTADAAEATTGAPSTNSARAVTAIRPTSDSMVLRSEHGSTVVAEDVVATLAGLAVREVPGVHSLVPFGASQRLTSLASNLRGREMRDLGVAVRIGTIECAIQCRVVLHYGESIPRVSSAVRDNVVERVESGTGLSVKRVDIDIVDLYFDEDHTAPVSDDAEVPLQ